MKSLSTHRRTPAAAAEVAARNAKRAAANATLPSMDAFMLIGNPSNPQQTAQIKKLTEAVEALTRGVVSA